MLPGYLLLSYGIRKHGFLTKQVMVDRHYETMYLISYKTNSITRNVIVVNIFNIIPWFCSCVSFP